MVMKRSIAMSVMIISLMMFTAAVLAQSTELGVKGSIVVISGDYSSGSIILTNSGNLAYDLVMFQDFRVVNEAGKEVSGFTFTMNRTNFINWKRGKSYVVGYRISAEKGIPAGDYSLLLRFRAISSGAGRLYILTARIPVRVIENPLRFGKLSMYVEGREGYNQIFNGDTLVVYSHVQNIGHFNVSGKATVYLEREGKQYLKQSREITLTPGDNVIKFEMKIPQDFSDGTYTLVYIIKYPSGEKRFTKNIKIGIGVEVINLSVKSSRVFLNENNVAYLTLIADRDISLRIEMNAISGGKVIYRTERVINVGSGSRVITLNLPTNSSGDIKTEVGIYYGTRLLRSFQISYQVVTYPVLSNVMYKKTGPNSIEIILKIENGNDKPVTGTLSYELYTEEKTLYKKSLKITIPSGALTMKLNFKVPVGEKVYYRFSLNALDRVTLKEGSLLLKSPSTSTSSSPSSTITKTTSSSPISTTSSSTEGRGGNAGLYAVIILVIAAIILVGYYENVKTRPRKRVRPKPKRKSPLGRFKRPKIPKFRENKELPKK